MKTCMTFESEKTAPVSGAVYGFIVRCIFSPLKVASRLYLGDYKMYDTTPRQCRLATRSTIPSH